MSNKMKSLLYFAGFLAASLLYYNLEEQNQTESTPPTTVKVAEANLAELEVGNEELLESLP